MTAGHCVVTTTPVSIPGLDDDDDIGLEISLTTIDKDTYYSTQSETRSEGLPPINSHHGHKIKLNQKLDLALVRVDDPVPQHPNVVLADELPNIGEDVLIMGHPDGMAFTFQKGMVSAYRDGIPGKDGLFMQLQAPIYNGDSGGGVFNERGELVGIVSSFEGTAIPTMGFAVSLSTIRSFIR